MNILAFPVHQIREDTYVEYQVNRLDEQIAAKEREIAKLAHDIWLLRLEKQLLTNE